MQVVDVTGAYGGDDVGASPFCELNRIGADIGGAALHQHPLRATHLPFRRNGAGYLLIHERFLPAIPVDAHRVHPR
jgi:hypothetical protein